MGRVGSASPTQWVADTLDLSATLQLREVINEVTAGPRRERLQRVQRNVFRKEMDRTVHNEKIAAPGVMTARSRKRVGFMPPSS